MRAFCFSKILAHPPIFGPGILQVRGFENANVKIRFQSPSAKSARRPHSSAGGGAARDLKTPVLKVEKCPGEKQRFFSSGAAALRLRHFAEFLNPDADDKLQVNTSLSDLDVAARILRTVKFQLR